MFQRRTSTKISKVLEAAITLNLTDDSAAPVPKWLLNRNAMQQSKLPISCLRMFARSSDLMFCVTYWLPNPPIWKNIKFLNSSVSTVWQIHDNYGKRQSNDCVCMKYYSNIFCIIQVPGHNNMSTWNSSVTHSIMACSLFVTPNHSVNYTQITIRFREERIPKIQWNIVDFAHKTNMYEYIYYVFPKEVEFAKHLMSEQYKQYTRPHMYMKYCRVE